MYVQVSPVEIRTLTQLNLICDSMITLPPISNFAPTSCHCPPFPVKENLVLMYKMALFHFFVIYKLYKSEIVKCEIAYVADCLYTWFSGLYQSPVKKKKKQSYVMDLFPSSGPHRDLFPVSDTVPNAGRDLSSREQKQIGTPKSFVVFGIRNDGQSPERK
jgi:hypothetical protein